MNNKMNKGYILHKLLLANDNNKIEELIKTIDTSNINDNGILSLVLSYFIRTNDIRINLLLSNRLMKRDYLMLCCYYYHSNYNYSFELFAKNILNNKNIQLLTKDIDYLIENKLYKLLILLKGYNINSSIDILSLYDYSNYIDYIDHNILQNIKDNIIIKQEYINEFSDYLSKINYDYIVDGCNVILYKGKISKKNIENLYRISCTLNCLVIIHKRHVKKNPEIRLELDKRGIKYYLTPFNNNDDLFIMLAFINNPKVYIVSNDKYRDHIFNYNQTLFDYNQFKNYLKQHTLSFTYDSIENINHKLDSIQVEDNNLIIPHISGKYLIISLK